MTVEELATQVAAELGEGWALADCDRRSSGIHIVNPEGVYLFLRDPDEYGHGRSNEKGKVRISGSFTKSPGYQAGDGPHYGLHRHAPEIMVSTSRGAAVIAKEIRRRLLAEVEEGFAEARANIARRVANEGARKAVTEELAGILHSPHHNVESGRVSWDGEGYGSITVGRSGVDGKIELSGVPIEILRDVVTTLAKHQPQEA